MGRVTIFSLPSCRHCVRAKALLARLEIPFVDVDIEAHPERGEDARALSYKTSAPQIFVNDSHLGGAKELEAAVETEEGERAFVERVRRALRAPDPSDPRLRLPGHERDDSDEVLRRAKAKTSTANAHTVDASPRIVDVDVAVEEEEEEVEEEEEESKKKKKSKSTRARVVMTVAEAWHLLTTRYTPRPLARKTRSRGLRTHKRCFERGALLECVARSDRVRDVVGGDEDRRRRVARDVADAFLRAGLIARVDGGGDGDGESRDDDDDDDDDARLYRLRADFEPNVLNAMIAWEARGDGGGGGGGGATASATDRTPDPADPRALIRDLSETFSFLRAAHLDPSTGNVAYDVMTADGPWEQSYRSLHAQTRWYHAFCYKACALRAVDLSRMTDEDEKLAFLVNVYNLMIVFAFARFGVPRSNAARYSFFDDVKVNIGGHAYSFNDIEQGLIRGNRRPPYHLRRTLRGGDVRRAFALARVDPRAHFALNCGASSCPPVKMYTPEGLDEELTLASKAFCEDSVTFDADANALTVSAILKWYRSDFGADDAAVARRVLTWLQGDTKTALENALRRENSSIKLRYAPYDWTVNATATSRSYEGVKTKVDVSRITGR